MRIISEETRAKMSAAAFRRWANISSTLADEHKAKISAANKGKKRTDEHKANYSAAKIGKNHPMYNKTQSDEWKAKRSASMIGKNKGKIRSDEQKARYSAAKKGVKWYYNPKTNDNKRLRPEQIAEYESTGYIPGRSTIKQA